MNTTLEKVAQLMVVVCGFFATVLVAIAMGATRMVSPARTAIVLALALALAVRYWWVILLLAWPTRWPRMVLLVLAWTAVSIIAATAVDPHRWALALAALSVIGCATEVYNGVTRQWLIGSEVMTRSLRRDHVIGAISAGVAAVVFVAAGALVPAELDVVVAVLVVADWVRLIAMIHRHQHFLDLESPT